MAYLICAGQKLIKSNSNSIQHVAPGALLFMEAAIFSH